MREFRPRLEAPKSDWIAYANDLELFAGVRRDDEVEFKTRRFCEFLKNQNLKGEYCSSAQVARLFIILTDSPNGLQSQTIANVLSANFGVAPRLADVVICKARATFKQIWGFNPIRNIWGFGYALTPEAAAKIKEIIET